MVKLSYGFKLVIELDTATLRAKAGGFKLFKVPGYIDPSPYPVLFQVRYYDARTFSSTSVL
jgi:hypothetical protein